MAKKHLWSHEVQAKWHPPEGFFKQSAESIAEGLKKASDSHDQAMDRLDFYINRAGKNLSGEDRQRLEKAKQILEDIFPKA